MVSTPLTVTEANFSSAYVRFLLQALLEAPALRLQLAELRVPQGQKLLPVSTAPGPSLGGRNLRSPAKSELNF